MLGGDCLIVAVGLIDVGWVVRWLVADGFGMDASALAGWLGADCGAWLIVADSVAFGLTATK